MSYVTGSFVHSYPSAAAALGAAVQVGDVIVVAIVDGAPNNTPPGAPSVPNDSLGNVYNITSADASFTGTGPQGSSRASLFTSLVTHAGTPTISITPGSGSADPGWSAWAERGLSSATPHKFGTFANTSGSPTSSETAAITTTVQCTMAVVWGNELAGTSFTSFAASASTLGYDSSHLDAEGRLDTIAAGSYNPGANNPSQDANMMAVIYLPETTSGVTASPGVGALTLAGLAPRVGHAATAGLGALALNGFAPRTAHAATTGVGVLTLTGFAPRVAHTTLPNVGALSLAGFAPTIVKPAVVTCGTGALSLTGFAPVVTPPVPPAATGPQGGGGRRIKWSELFPDSKDPTITRELTKAEGDALFAHAAPTREDAMLLAFLLHSLDED